MLVDKVFDLFQQDDQAVTDLCADCVVSAINYSIVHLLWVVAFLVGYGVSGEGIIEGDLYCV